MGITAIKKIKQLVPFSAQKIGTIYMLHRCAPIDQKNLYWNEHLKVSPEYLKNFLENHIKTHIAISLDELYLLSTKKKLKKPFFIMTFDDGYRDNYEYALPLFDELKVPFTVYITNSFPDKKAFLWWYILEDIIQTNNTILLSNGDKYISNTKNEKEKAFLQLRSLVLKLNQTNLQEEFKKLFYNYGIDFTSYNDNLCLSWNMVHEMSNSSYCTIAAHTMNHKTLNQLSDTELEYEILFGKKSLEKEIGKPVKHFSYPFGTFNEVGSREVEFIKSYGFDTAAYSFGGNVNKKNIGKIYELPRVFLGELTH
jgi:peptidoglycan/xylan/chitin deacetylase (PgdA/CDA1 family)